MSFMIVDAWLLFFSKKVNFTADLRRTYVCGSAVALIETHPFGVPLHSFSVLLWHRETKTAVDNHINIP